MSKEAPCGESYGHTIKVLVQKHHRVIAFSKNVDKLFSLIALAEVFLNTIVICALGLFFVAVSIKVSILRFIPQCIQLSDLLTKQSVDETGIIMMKIIFSYGAIMAEIFIYCFVGEFLSLKVSEYLRMIYIFHIRLTSCDFFLLYCSQSKSLADAAYDSLWYNTSSKQGKDLLFIIMRSQKPLTIRAGGIKNLSFEAFASVSQQAFLDQYLFYALYFS